VTVIFVKAFEKDYPQNISRVTKLRRILNVVTFSRQKGNDCWHNNHVNFIKRCVPSKMGQTKTCFKSSRNCD